MTLGLSWVGVWICLLGGLSCFITFLAVSRQKKLPILVASAAFITSLVGAFLMVVWFVGLSELLVPGGLK